MVQYCVMLVTSVLVVMLSLNGGTTAFSCIPSHSKVPAYHGRTSPFHLVASSSSSSSSLLSSSNDDANNEKPSLKQQAETLRRQADEMEQELKKTRRPKDDENSKISVIPTITNLNDSIWTFRYRFSSQPLPEDDDEEVATVFYSGSLSVRLLGDGYSEIVEHKPRGSVTQSNDGDGAADNSIQITKVWGWDEEFSNEDEETYLLFSMDVTFPRSDPKLPQRSERYYYQARIATNEKSAIALQDGTITCKKDITEKTGGRWGLFQVAGILTAFRYVGDFSAKPAAPSER